MAPVLHEGGPQGRGAQILTGRMPLLPVNTCAQVAILCVQPGFTAASPITTCLSTRTAQPLLVGRCAHHHSRYVHAVRRVLHKAHSLQYSHHALQIDRPLICCLTPAGCSQPHP